MADTKDVFISYDMETDAAVVKDICDKLEKTYHISCWYASRNHIVGHFRKASTKAIDNSRIAVLVLTGRTMISDNITYELEVAFQNIKKSDKTTGDIKIVCLDGRVPDEEIRFISGFKRIYAGSSAHPDSSEIAKVLQQALETLDSHPVSVPDPIPVPPKETPVPKEKPPVSPKETPVPKKETPVPKKETPVPKKEPPVPKKETPVPKKETPVPKKETPVPKKKPPHKIFPGKLLKVILTALHNASPFFVVFLCLFALYSFIKHGTTIPVGPEDEVKVKKYEEAAMLSRSRNRADRLQAAIIWGGLGKYKDSRERSMEIWAEYREPAVISAGFTHTVALTDNGDVMTAGDEKEEENELSNVVTWHNMIEISAGNGFTVGLRDDYKTIAVGRNNNGQCRVNSGWYEKGDWSNIVSISANDSWTVALREDGRALVTGNGKDSRCFEEDGFWSNDIVAVSAGRNHIVGLRLDGTVVTDGNENGNTYGQREVRDWDNIIAVGAGADYTVGLRLNGEVVTAGGNGRLDGVNEWRNIEAISAGYYHIIGLTKGQAVGVGDNSDGQIDVYGNDWRNLAAVSAGWRHTVGLRDDGTVVSTGHNSEGQGNLEEWNGNVRIPR